MLRAASALCLESQALDLLAATRRDPFKLFRSSAHTSAPLASQVQRARKLKKYRTTVLSSGAAPAAPAGPEPVAPPPASKAPPPPPPPRRSWTVAAAALALTASIGGVYFYRRLNEDDGGGGGGQPSPASDEQKKGKDADEDVYPRSGAAFPPHVQYLLVGAGTAAFAAMRALRSARPESRVLMPRSFPPHVQYLLVGAGTAAFAAMRALRSARPESRVLMVGEERVLPYMRPPLSKELWREAELATRATAPDSLTFRQWNGKRRSLVYEPRAFYAPIEHMAAGGDDAKPENETARVGGASVALGWRVSRLDVARHEAELVSPRGETVTLTYDKCLVATGVTARRVGALRGAAAAGRSLALRGLRDAARLAAALEEPAVRRVAVVGGGFLATELSAALADRLRDSGRSVVQVVAEAAPMAAVLPEYLARDAASRLREEGVTLITSEEVTHATMQDGRVHMELSSGAVLDADLVVECVGAEPDVALAAASGLETHDTLGGVVVNAELQARTDVYAAGDAACFHDPLLGRRRVEHHDHAVVSGRLAGQNMAAITPPGHYEHQSMFWSDLGPRRGYEAIGIIDSRLPTVGVFSADAVVETSAKGALAGTTPETDTAKAVTEPDSKPDAAAEGAGAGAGADARYERGVVFYLRGRRVVGVLLWNLFNRMHIARQVLAHGEFEDLFEVAKLFAPHEEE